MHHFNTRLGMRQTGWTVWLVLDLLRRTDIGRDVSRNQSDTRGGGLRLYSHLQLALYSVHIGPKFLRQSQLHLGVLPAGQVILQVSLIPIPQDTISQELDPSAIRGGLFGHATPSWMPSGAGSSIVEGSETSDLLSAKAEKVADIVKNTRAEESTATRHHGLIGIDGRIIEYLLGSFRGLFQ